MPDALSVHIRQLPNEKLLLLLLLLLFLLLMLLDSKETFEEFVSILLSDRLSLDSEDGFVLLSVTSPQERKKLIDETIFFMFFIS